MNQGFKYYLKIYLAIITQDIKSKMQYRMDFFISTLGMIATNLSGLISFWILFRSIPNIQGWDYHEMIFIYAFSLLAVTPVQLFFDNLWNINDKVLRGDFIVYCFRPLNIFFYYMSEVFDVKGLSQLIFGCLLLIYSWASLHIQITVVSILFLFVTLLGASLVMIGIMVLACSSAFWITNSTSVLVFMFKFKDYSKYPITIFNTVFRFIFSFLIPIGFIAFYPSEIFLRPKSTTILALASPVIGIAFFILAYFVWMYGARKYSGTGS
ncbi:MAG: ABC-2 family transporter protein [Bacillota bacterium]|nr:ABC-2 family transporter protein [Bacillota bacterium]